MFLNLMKRMQARKVKDKTDPGPNMQELFHGTDVAVIHKIIEHNFNRSFNKVTTHHDRRPFPKVPPTHSSRVLSAFCSVSLGWGFWCRSLLCAGRGVFRKPPLLKAK